MGKRQFSHPYNSLRKRTKEHSFIIIDIHTHTQEQSSTIKYITQLVTI
jgi:hypothetical protein